MKKIYSNIADKYIAVLRKNVNETVVGAKCAIRTYVIEGTNYRVLFDGYYSHEGGKVYVRLEEKMVNGRYFRLGMQECGGNLSQIYYGMIACVESIIERHEKECEDIS